MSDKQFDLGPMIAQVQTWWTKQHDGCPSNEPDPLGRPWEGLSWLYTDEELGQPICSVFCGWRRDRSRDEFVATLRNELKATSVRAAGLLEQPDTKRALAVASALAPQPVGSDLSLITDLIEIAGAQTVQERQQAVSNLVGTVLVGCVVLLFGAWVSSARR